MRRALSYILPLLVAFIALIPPIRFRIPAPTEHWPFMIAIAGFLGIRILFIRTNIFVKFASLLSFLVCFFSSIPYLSFNSYVVIVAHLYLYIGLTMMKSWKPMFAMVKSLFVYNALLILLQATGHDQMLNWSLNRITCYGITGQHMQMGSYSVILSCLLVVISPWFMLFPIVAAVFCNSSGAFMCAALGIFTYFMSKPHSYRWPSSQLINRRQNKKNIILFLSICLIITAGFFAFFTGKVQANLSPIGRLGIWKASLILLKEHPFVGWGPGTYKGAFPALSKAFCHIDVIPWRSAHNDFVQLAFEFGYPIAFLTLFALCFVFLKLIRLRALPGAPVLIAGFVMLNADMIVHFPTRLAELCPLFISFLAYLDVWMKEYPKNIC